jgi:hypothetical protein
MTTYEALTWTSVHASVKREVLTRKQATKRFSLAVLFATEEAAQKSRDGFATTPRADSDFVGTALRVSID